MPASTNFNQHPYWNDYDQRNDFYGMLFKPAVAVQVRELNQLQSILQNQIEQFGDNVLKRGTIVSGCNFTFHEAYPYVKIKDVETDGTPVDPSILRGYHLTSPASGVRAYIADYAEGFEASDPDLKTLYLSYVNAGNDGNTHTFQAGQTLRVTDANSSIWGVLVNDGSLGFSNTDTVVFTPAVVVNVATGSFSNGSYVIQSSTGANLQIVGIDSTTLSYANQVILTLKPRDVDLANSSKTSTAWTFSNGESITNAGNTAAATIVQVLGSAANAVLTTDSSGTITDIAMRNRGLEYAVQPTIRVRSIGHESAMSALNLEPKGYIAQIRVASVANAVGNGYAFGVSEGHIYQKGYFLRVAPQTKVVSKYNQSPNNLSIGFISTEDIVDSNEDTSLLDNALGEPNETAPGADRLRITPELSVVNTDSIADGDDFFPIVEWSEGKPYRQRQYTEYNAISAEMERRTSEESGDYAVDRFFLTTRSPQSINAEGNVFSVVVDPGTAYISGKRVHTDTSYTVDVTKGHDVTAAPKVGISVNYGSYVRVKEVGGVFQFSTGDTVKLYTTAKGFLSNAVAVTTPNTSPLGSQIGTARIRSLTRENGTPGTANAIYRLYLFDLRMNQGKNFANVRSIYYDGATYKGICDTILEGNNSIIKAANTDRLIFNAARETIRNTSNVNYYYRTIDQTLTFANTGILTKTLVDSGETFPYSTTMSDTQLKGLYVVPTGNNLIAADPITGNVSVGSGSNVVTGDGTSIVSELRVSDWVYVYANSTGGGDIKQVRSIANDTSLTLDSNPSFTNATAKVARAFPKNVPIPLGDRDGLMASDLCGNLNPSALTMTLRLRQSNGANMSLVGTTTIAATVAHNVYRANAAPTSKTAVRSRFVKIRPANSFANGTASRGANAAGLKLSGNTTSAQMNVVSGTPTTYFANGDYIYLWTSNSGAILRTISTVNSTAIVLTSNNTVLNATMNVAVANVNWNGPWCLGVPDAFRLRGVYAFSNSSVNTASRRVTSDFYIDHNQTPNFYDLSYLCHKPKYSYRLGRNDWLLVHFDYFTGGSGFYDTTSYTGTANAQEISIRDSLPLANLTAGGYVNMLEVPELFDAKGAIYDPLMSLDFRPMATNTAAPNANQALAPVNPSPTLGFGNTADPANDKKFPLPDAMLTACTMVYCGRTDTVVVDSSSRISVLRGKPAVDIERRVSPQVPSDSMKVNDVLIPAYPNIPTAYSNVVAEILDTKVANEQYQLRRARRSVIQTPTSAVDLDRNQPAGYTMEDIGQIDRRLRDVEYYVELSLLERNVRDMVIPSGIDPTVNRFKFGFFVDDFSTRQFSDTANPGYAATIEDDDVVPPKISWNLPIDNPGPFTDPPYFDYMVAEQRNATVRRTVNTSNTTNSSSNTLSSTPNTAGSNTGSNTSGYPICTGTGNAVTANTIDIRRENITVASMPTTLGQTSIPVFGGGTGFANDVLDVFNLDMSSTAAAATLFFWATKGVQILVYQGTANTKVKTVTTSDAATLSAADRTFMLSNSVPQGWFSNPSINLSSSFSVAVSNGQANFVKNAGKISWTHTPGSGTSYTIVARRANTAIGATFRYAVRYPQDAGVALPCGPVPNSAPATYNGTMTVAPGYINLTPGEPPAFDAFN